MSHQELNNCVLTVGGSYTSNVNINLTFQSYFQTAMRTSSRSSRPSDNLSKLLLDAERLRRSAEQLSQELKFTSSPPIEYNDLATVLDEIAENTIPCIFRLSVDVGYHFDKRCEQRVLVEIASMQTLLDDFVMKKATGYNRAPKSLRRTFRVEAFIELLWSCFWWLFFAKYLITVIRKSLGISRDRIYAALFESMAFSMGRRIRCHQIEIEDFFAAQWSLPQDLCLDRQVFLSILRFKYQGGPAELVIMSEQFGVFRQGGLRVIQALDWESVINEGDGLQLSVLVKRQSGGTTDNSDAAKCPQCGHSAKTISGNASDGWLNCLGCNTTFNLTSVDSKDANGNDAGDRGSSRRKSLSSDGAEPWEHSSTFRCFSIVTLVRSFREDASRGPENSDEMQTSLGFATQIRPEISPGRVIPDVLEQGRSSESAIQVPSSATFSFEFPTSAAFKQRRVSFALPSTPKVRWDFRGDTGVDSHVPEAETMPEKRRKMANGSEKNEMPQEKKQRKKWTEEETQMLVTGCNIHGVGNWKAILSNPNLKFDNRSPVDLKDRFRTYFPDAYREYYPNARTHLSGKVRSTLPNGTSLFEKPRSKKRRSFTKKADREL